MPRANRVHIGLPAGKARIELVPGVQVLARFAQVRVIRHPGLDGVDARVDALPLRRDGLQRVGTVLDVAPVPVTQSARLGPCPPQEADATASGPSS